MKKVMSLFLFIFTITTHYSAHAILSMELTRGVAGAIPIAVVPFATNGNTPSQNVSGIVAKDLQNSGRFNVLAQSSLIQWLDRPRGMNPRGRPKGRAALLPLGNPIAKSLPRTCCGVQRQAAGNKFQFPSDARDVSNDYFHQLGSDNVLVGKVQSVGGGRYQVSFQLLDMYRGKGAASIVLSKKYTVFSNELRAVAHHISDLIYQQIIGVRGVFSTKLAYVVVQQFGGAPSRYILEVSDQDGYNPRPLMSSSEPIMSPAWSPNGRQIAYVSFENKQAGIYVQDVATGGRRLFSGFPGINGAPAWSPNGRKLALVLSKSGAPNIYIMDIGARSLTQVTHDFYINTEPAWSPDGRSLLFTSNRSGGPQIYQINLATGAVSRLSYDGDYNARASYTRDGNHVAMIHRVSGIFNIGILDLDSGTIRVLNSSAGDSSSPSIAPNGSMILYDTIYGGRSVLGMVSSDGRVQLVLPARNGDAQDPAWSPFL